jgi:hypothetical protein
MIAVKSISSGQNGMRPSDDRKAKTAPDGAAFFMVDGIV